MPRLKMGHVMSHLNLATCLLSPNAMYIEILWECKTNMINTKRTEKAVRVTHVREYWHL